MPLGLASRMDLTGPMAEAFACRRCGYVTLVSNHATGRWSTECKCAGWRRFLPGGPRLRVRLVTYPAEQHREWREALGAIAQYEDHPGGPPPEDAMQEIARSALAPTCNPLVET